MHPTPLPTLTTLRDDLLSAAADFAALVLAHTRGPRRDPASASLVLITTDDPPRARLFGEKPDGEMRLIGAAVPPPALGDAAARALTEGLARLPAAARANVARLAVSGAGRLVMMVDLAEQAAILALDPGDVDGLVTLAVLGDAGHAITH